MTTHTSIKGRKMVECENGFCENKRHYVGSEAHMACIADLENRRYKYAPPSVSSPPAQMRGTLNPERKYEEISANAPSIAHGQTIRPKDFNTEDKNIGITNRIRPVNGVNHYQTVALKPVQIARLGKVIPAGSRGGWVAEIETMSQHSWVDENSMVGKNIRILKGTYVVNSELDTADEKGLKLANSSLKNVRTLKNSAPVHGVINNADLLDSRIAGPVIVYSGNNEDKNDIVIHNSLLNKTEIVGESIMVDSCSLPDTLIGGIKSPQRNIMLRGVRADAGTRIKASNVALTSNLEVKKLKSGLSITADKKQAPKLVLKNVKIEGDSIRIIGDHKITSTQIKGSPGHKTVISSKENLTIDQSLINSGSRVNSSLDAFSVVNPQEEVNVLSEKSLF